MHRRWTVWVAVTLCACSTLSVSPGAQARKPGPRLEQLKGSAAGEIDRMGELVQQMVDTMFSFGELGFQEFETSRYCTGVLRKNGFQVEEGIAGIPTAWMASWGSGKPVIALGSDIDGLPQTSQKPGVAFRSPLIEGAPGHGEGHNSGQALNIAAALAVKKIMESEHLPGTIKLWPGVAEEQLAGKAHYVRAGCFKDVDVVLFTHVGDNLAVSYGSDSNSGLVSVEYTFHGASAHSAGAPWRGRSALDAVELMNVGWNYRREHLRLQQRSHYVITNGGDQPNVVPPTASVWYFFRETDYARIKELRDIGNTIAEAAAMMTATTMTHRALGAAWPGHFNQPVAEAVYENIRSVGLPQWTEADHSLAKAVQRQAKAPEKGLNTEAAKLGLPVKEEDKRGGGSDDIGDVSWTVPTVTLRYPANIPGLPGHSWLNAIAMATPIAHKGVAAGSKVIAFTVLDLLLEPGLVRQAWDYFRNVQTKDTQYKPLLDSGDKPALELNRRIMERFRPEMRRYYYDSSKYKTYLEQLGVQYPQLEQ